MPHVPSSFIGTIPPSFQSAHGNDPTAADLLEFLNGLISGELSNLVPVHLTSSESEQWITLVSTLSEHFLEGFPGHDFGLWSALHEKAVLASISLEVIRRIVIRVHGLFSNRHDLTKTVLQRHHHMLSSLSSWEDSVKLAPSEIKDIEELHNKTLAAMVEILRQIASVAAAIPAYSPIYEQYVANCTIAIRSFVGDASYPLPTSVNFFRQPVLQEYIVGSEPRPETVLTTKSQVTAFIVDVSHILLQSLAGSLSKSIALSCFHRRCSNLVRVATDFLLSPSCRNKRRIKSILTILRCIASHTCAEGTCDIVLGSICHEIFVFRLREGPALDSVPVDEVLRDIFSAGTRRVNSTAAMDVVLEVVGTPTWDDSDSISDAPLLTCVNAITNGLDEAMILHALQVIGLRQPTAISQRLDKMLRDSLLRKTAAREIPTRVVLHDQIGIVSWRSKVSDALKTHQLDTLGIIDEWPSQGTSLTDTQWLAQVLDVLVRKSSQFCELGCGERIRICQFLAQLPCLATHPESENCSGSMAKPGLAFLQAYIALFMSLRSMPTSKDDISVSRQSYNALSIALRHHTRGFNENMLRTARDIIGDGMQCANRSIRLSAGRAFVEFLRACQRCRRDHPTRLDSVFILIHDLLANQADPIKETTLITLGFMARLQDPNIVGRSLLCLLIQLDQSNTLLRGVSYMQLVNLAKYHGKSRHGLLAPHLHEIAPFVVSNIHRQPNILVELCRFLGCEPHQFLSATLNQTLPTLFGQSSSDALERLSDILNQDFPTLFLHCPADILAHVYMLPAHVQCEQALAFIVKGLSENAKKDIISLSQILKSFLVSLLANLVIALGHEDSSQVDLSSNAIRKVERSLTHSEATARATEHHLGNFLKSHVLGILAYLNDALQDVYGKKSVVIKQQALRGLASLIREIGASITSVASQIMATLQTVICIDALSECAVQTWLIFLQTMPMSDLSTHVGPSSATLVDIWPRLSVRGRELAKQAIEHMVLGATEETLPFLNDVVELSSIPELAACSDMLNSLRESTPPIEQLRSILRRISNDNATVVGRALQELRTLMSSTYAKLIRDLASGDAFDPLIAEVVHALMSVVTREAENFEVLRLAALECFGILGAIDPDRFDIIAQEKTMVVLRNFADETEAIDFAIHLIQDVLVRAFRSTNDTKFQGHLAYAIQELLRFCNFTPALVLPGSQSSVPLKVRSRWNGLQKHVLETVTPLLEARYSIPYKEPALVEHPIYPLQQTYREWIQIWTSHLITKAAGVRAQAIFKVFCHVVRNREIGVTHHLLPHIILNIVISGDIVEAQQIRQEMNAVLADQVDPSSTSSGDKRSLSAQAVFMIMDHLNKWVRHMRQWIGVMRAESAKDKHRSDKQSRPAAPATLEEAQLDRVNSILVDINPDLVARAAFQCKSYARSLMNFETQIISLRNDQAATGKLQSYYDKLHEIYSQLDEPDGMEGISLYVLAPSLEHQIRQHESTGRWTSAQSCWEVQLQGEPDNLEYHLGLLRCLRNLGHYDTLRTHIRGVLARNPKWESALASFQVEGAWIVGDWDAVKGIVDQKHIPSSASSELAIAQLLLAMHTDDEMSVASALSCVREDLGSFVISAGEVGYRQAYDAILNLHIVRDLEIIYETFHACRSAQPLDGMKDLSHTLSMRLNSTLPTYRTHEPILSMHRTGFSLSCKHQTSVRRLVGDTWLASSKIARKAGHWQTAYSAVLQAQEGGTPSSFFQRSKLVKASGEPLRALQELENSLQAIESDRKAATDPHVIDLTEDNSRDEEMMLIEAKAKLLRARWKWESERFDAGVVLAELSEIVNSCANWESAHYHAGHFQDECYKALSGADKNKRGALMNLYTVKSYAMAIRLGSKFAYQTIPRLLTLWLDMGEDPSLTKSDTFTAINTEINGAVRHTPVYKWLTAFPQIVSRVDHPHQDVSALLNALISAVLSQYPQQGLWLFMAVVKSTKSAREKRGRQILERVKNNPKMANTDVPMLVHESVEMATELLRLCDAPIKADKHNLSMARDFPTLARRAPSPLIIPLQESLTANLPPASTKERDHQPFPPDAPTISHFFDDIDVMKSLARPRKISIRGSNGKVYMFLGKPKDDLRKDARLMDFNSIINKLLRTNPESRRRKLRIRTYSVVTLNEECGFIQWVPNTMPIRPILLKQYASRGVEPYSRVLDSVFKKVKGISDKEAADAFRDQVLPGYPPVLHEWFIETFPEPSAWLSSRLAYGRTAAVMSMVGFILGLGDRHLENILLDTNAGDVVHVDFNCLFEKGKTLQTPEKVPFRLTNNMVDGLGVTGVEGVFRIASELTMQLLRENKDILMSVLDAFIHDPLVEWEDEKRKLEKRTRGDRNSVREQTDLRKLAQTALQPIEKKLNGLYQKNTNYYVEIDKEVSISNLVQMLIEEATDLRNLARMYVGWAPWQ